jgi:hypothetical protein
MNEAAEECQRAFGVVCSFIGTRDLVQEHIAFRVWPLAEKLEMPQEAIKEADEGGLIRLKYTFKFGDKFTEPDDDWLKSIENLSDELLGTYSKAEDTALSAAFGGRKKKRLNRVFDAIGFVYPDYRYPIRGQKRKNTTSAKEEVATAPSEPEPERKRIKVLTHRPRYIEPASVPEYTRETSSATEAGESTEPSLLPKIAEMAEASPRINLKEPNVLLPESEEMAEAPLKEKMEKGSTEGSKVPAAVSPSANVEIKSQKSQVVTPKRKRMVTVLDVLETIESSSSTSKQTAKTSEAETEVFDAEAPKLQAETEAGPSEPTKEEKTPEPLLVEEVSAATPEASPKIPDYIVRHASGKNYQKKNSKKPGTTPKS